MKTRRGQAARQAAAASACVPVGNWLLAPEGGIIHPAERTAVIADVHLGYEWARGAAGDCVPRHSLDETLRRLGRLLERSPVDRLIIAGDLVESARPCRRTAAEVLRLGRWLEEREIRLVLLRGNHDGGLDWLLRRGGIAMAGSQLAFRESLVVDGWTIVHGHAGTTAEKLILGHHHPVLRAAGGTFPCFLAASSCIVLPAFSRNAAGLDVASVGAAPPWPIAGLSCLASTGEEVLDFGGLGDLGQRIRGHGG